MSNVDISAALSVNVTAPKSRRGTGCRRHAANLAKSNIVAVTTTDTCPTSVQTRGSDGMNSDVVLNQVTLSFRLCRIENHLRARSHAHILIIVGHCLSTVGDLGAAMPT